MQSRAEILQLSKEQLADRVLHMEDMLLKMQNELDLYKKTAPERAYYASLKMLNQQINYLNDFDLESNIGSSPKDDKVYDRAIAIFEKMTENATRIDNLYKALILSGDEKKDTNRPKQGLSSESVADSLGDIAGLKKN